VLVTEGELELAAGEHSVDAVEVLDGIAELGEGVPESRAGG
jgi:hypothetical protein